MENELTLGSLFDGIGGFPLAAIHCGVKPIWVSEIEAFPIEVTKKRFPGMLHVGALQSWTGRSCRLSISSAAAAHVRTCPWLGPAPD